MKRNKLLEGVLILVIAVVLTGCFNPGLKEFVKANKSTLDENMKMIEEQIPGVVATYEIVSDKEIVVTAKFEEIPAKLREANLGLDAMKDSLDEALADEVFGKNVETVATDMAKNTNLDTVSFTYRFVDPDGVILSEKKFTGSK